MMMVNNAGENVCVKFSDAALRLKGQPMFKVLSAIEELERQGKNLIHFEIGDPDFSTPPNIVMSACEALEQGRTHYTDSLGLYELRMAIAEYIKKTRGFKPDISQVVVTPSANIIIYYAVQCLANPGDEVIIQDPAFPSYDAALSLCGVRAVRVPLREENKFCIVPDDIKSLVTKRTRMIIINSPHNPTGAVMGKNEFEEIANLCIDKNIYLYSDEIYAKMIYDNAPFYSPSVIDECKSNIILATGFSKAYAMTGWRLGFCIVPEKLGEKFGLMIQTTTSCVSEFIQIAAIEALSGDQTDIDLMMNEYKKRRDVLVQGLNNISGVSCLTPRGSFYVYPNITKTGLSSRDFANISLNNALVGLLPGTDFGESGEGYVRLCYAASMEDINEGIDRLSHVFNKKLYL